MATRECRIGRALKACVDVPAALARHGRARRRRNLLKPTDRRALGHGLWRWRGARSPGPTAIGARAFWLTFRGSVYPEELEEGGGRTALLHLASLTTQQRPVVVVASCPKHRTVESGRLPQHRKHCAKLEAAMAKAKVPDWVQEQRRQY